MAKRTLDDYTKDAVELKVYFGKLLPEQIAPASVQTYLEEGKRAGRPTRDHH